MVQSETDLDDGYPPSFSYFAESEEDPIFEENIDAFDEKMDNDDDGIAHSQIHDDLEEDHDEEDHGDEDHIHPYDLNDELEDYDELED